MTTSAVAQPLTSATLADLPDGVAVPHYDRSALVPGIVHIGVGGFHRAHQAVYLDDLAGQGHRDWGLVGVGLHRAEMGEVLAAQDGLYLVVERDAEGDSARVVGVMDRYLFAPEDPEAVLDALADERTRVVTLTITGTAYNIDPESGEFEADVAETEEIEDAGRPATVFGYITEALDRRRQAGLAPFTVLSCDNMAANGRAARTAVVSYARLRDERRGGDLADWIDAHVTFPSSMVDRITPSTTPEERESLVAEIGVADRWPVVTEPFRQWVIEDAFCNGRPPLEAVGVQFVDDVAPYEAMKTRLLNASHCALGYLGYLAGHRTTDEVLADDPFREYLTRMMADEIVPLLDAVPGVDLDAYQRTLIERLSNPRMGDQLERLCRRGSTKIPNYVLPSILAARAQGRSHRLLTVAVAGWLRFLRGYDYAGDDTPVQGPRMHLLDIARGAGEDPRPLLAQDDVFGQLGRDPGFAGEVEEALRALEGNGPREVLELYLSGDRARR